MVNLQMFEESKRKILDNMNSKVNSISIEEDLKLKHNDQNIYSNRTKELWKIGINNICANKTAALILAGGSGSRLGYDKPKMYFPFSQAQEKSLLEINIKKLLVLKEISESNKFVPLCLMISKSYRNYLESYLEENDYFGYDSKCIYIFEQLEYPAFNMNNDEFALDENGDIILRPMGNGAIYKSIFESGVLQELKNIGVENIHIVTIDNPLIRLCDPYICGALSNYNLEVLNECINRLPGENVGVNLISPHTNSAIPKIIEYTHLKDLKNPIDSNYSNICSHYMSLQYIEMVANKHNEDYLRLNTVSKKFNENINIRFPEIFIFDPFSDPNTYVKKYGVFYSNREHVFAPIKNAGEGKDTHAESCQLWSQRENQLIKINNLKDTSIDLNQHLKLAYYLN